MLAKFGLVLIFAVVAFILYVRHLESNSVFHPERALLYTPADQNLPFENIYFNTPDGVRLHGWYVGEYTDAYHVLFFHGNAGNISDRIGKLEFFHSLGFNVLIIDYRGFGNSEGYSTEKTMYIDAQAAYDYLTEEKNISTDKLIIYGASLGGAAAVDLASKNASGGIVIDSSFSNGVDMAKHYFPHIPSFIISVRLDSTSKIKKVSVPKLFLHSPEDRTVPIELGRKLYNTADEPKLFIELIGGHNDSHIQSEDKVKDALVEFMLMVER